MMGFDAVQELQLDPRLKRIHYDWLEAANHTQRTVAKISRQLRRFLDDKTSLENKRIIDILQDIQAAAINVRDNLPEGVFMEVDESAATVALPFERPPFSPPVKPVIEADVIKADGAAINAEVLFEQFMVDRAKLESRINTMLQTSEQLSLSELTRKYPVKKGVVELVNYFAIAAEKRTVFDEEQKEAIILQDETGHEKHVEVPRVIFTR
jgi:hypothetical protein